MHTNVDVSTSALGASAQLQQHRCTRLRIHGMHVCSLLLHGRTQLLDLFGLSLKAGQTSDLCMHAYLFELLICPQANGEQEAHHGQEFTISPGSESHTVTRQQTWSWVFRAAASVAFASTAAQVACNFALAACSSLLRCANCSTTCTSAAPCMAVHVNSCIIGGTVRYSWQIPERRSGWLHMHCSGA